MAEIIPLQSILHTCVEAIEQSLRIQLEEFTVAPVAEKAVLANKIRKLGELLEYATNLL
jgi:hypothetical protein